MKMMSSFVFISQFGDEKVSPEFSAENFSPEFFGDENFEKEIEKNILEKRRSFPDLKNFL